MKKAFAKYSGAFLLVILLSAKICTAQNATIVKFESLQKILDTKADQIQVINFWATWCAPCVKELPLLEKLGAKDDLNIKITLINLDYADKVDKVNSFIKRKGLQSEVLLLDEIDYNSWIDKVDKSWSGAIPATLILNPITGKRKFVEKELQEGELEKLVAAIQ